MTSTIKVNTVTTESGSTLTLGESGKTVALASGASQTGFGRTGTVNWVTTKKTADFTAVSGEGYFCDTAAVGAFTLTLPSSPSAGDIVGLKDYNGNFANDNLTIDRNGSPINGGSSANPPISTNGASIFLVYVDGTQGWVATQDDSSVLAGATYIVGTGGTETTSGNCKIHTFTSPGTFTVCSVSGCAVNNVISYAVVAGGGGGSVDNAGGGGGGGYRETKSPVTGYTASPLCGYSTPANRITVTATSYPITVGGGGAAHPGTSGGNGSDGTDSTFSTITSAGGGRGGANPTSSYPANTGGSGGGAGIGSQGPVPGPGCNTGAAGNTPPTTPPQGNNGGTASHSPGNGNAGGGGGGATAVGGNAGVNPTSPQISGGAGGAGATTCISGNPLGYGGGAGGSAGNAASGGGGSPCGSGGYAGANTTGPSTRTGAPPTTPPTASSAGIDNRGGGGGSINCGSTGSRASNGGSGVVIIRYRYS